MARIKFGKRSLAVPNSRPARISLGVVLVLAGGLGGWLPVLGFWMVPLGLVVLSVDIPAVRRFRRKTTVRGLRWWRGEKGAPRKPGEPDASPKQPLRDSSILP